MNTKDIKEEYAFATSQYRLMMQTFGNTFTIAISGVLIGLIMAVEKYPSSGPVFLILPFIIVGWYIMMELQGKEINARWKYISLLEKKIQELTGQAFPCAASRLVPHIYSTWRYQPLWVLIGSPIFLIYIFVCIKAMSYIHVTKPNYYIPALVIYIILPVVPMVLMHFTGSAIDKELSSIKVDLLMSKKDVQQKDADKSEPLL